LVAPAELFQSLDLWHGIQLLTILGTGIIKKSQPL
jgi:hypothetical protein